MTGLKTKHRDKEPRGPFGSISVDYTPDETKLEPAPEIPRELQKSESVFHGPEEIFRIVWDTKGESNSVQQDTQRQSHQ